MFHNSPPWTWAFHTEIVGIVGLICILIYALLTKKYWSTSGYNSGIFAMAATVFFFMMYALYISEINWHTSGLAAIGPFYPTERFISSLVLAFFKFFLLALTFCCLHVYMPFLAENNNKWEYAALLIVLTLAMLILISTVDLFIAFISIEVQTITLYIMIGLKRYSNLSMEAAQKFFFFAAFSSCCFGLGLSLFYAIAGTTNIYKLSLYFKSLELLGEGMPWVALLASMLILISLLFKLTLIPFHLWVADVFQGTYGYFNSYLAIVSKLPVIFLFAKFYYLILLVVSPFFAVFIQMISLFSISWGAVYAFTEINFKRFWALTAIVNLGYIIFALSLGTIESFVIALFYLFLYLLNTLFIWILVIHLAKRPGVEFTFNEFLTKVASWISLGQYNMPLAVIFVFVLFSLAGLPPGTAFIPKAWLLLHLYMLSNFFSFIVIFSFSFLNMAYYIRLARFALFVNSQKIKTPQESFEPIASFYVYILLVIFFINIFCMIFFFDSLLPVLKLSEALFKIN